MRPRPRHISFLTNAAGCATRLFIPLFAHQHGASLPDIGFTVAGLARSIATVVLFIYAWDFGSMLMIQILLGFSWATLYVGALNSSLRRTRKPRLRVTGSTA